MQIQEEEQKQLGDVSQMKLKNLLVEYAQNIGELDEARQELLADGDFSIKQAFIRIDADKDQKIGSREIVSFLLDNRVSSVNSWDVNDQIISKFDQDKDGSLDYKEFSRIFLPLGLDAQAQKNHAEKEEVQELTNELEQKIASVFEKMSQIDKNIEPLRRELKQSPDYTFEAAYETIAARDKAAGISKADIAQFLSDNGYKGDPISDRISINLDANGDGLISQEEFKEFLDGKVANPGQESHRYPYYRSIYYDAPIYRSIYDYPRPYLYSDLYPRPYLYSDLHPRRNLSYYDYPVRSTYRSFWNYDYDRYYPYAAPLRTYSYADYHYDLPLRTYPYVDYPVISPPRTRTVTTYHVSPGYRSYYI